MYKFETYETTPEVIERVRELESKGMDTRDLRILSLNDIDRDLLEGTPNDTVSFGEKFTAFFSSDDPEEKLFEKYGIQEEDIPKYISLIERGGHVLLLDLDDYYIEQEDDLKSSDLRFDEKYDNDELKDKNVPEGVPVDKERYDSDKKADIPLKEDLEDEDKIRLHEERLKVNKENVKTGDVVLDKEVVTETQTIDVPVEKERLTIERKPVEGEIKEDFDTNAKPEKITIPLSEEKVTVDKDTVVTEEVEIKKDKEIENEKISGDVKKEELEVTENGNIEEV